MGLTRCRLGDLVQRLDFRNEGSVYGLGDVRGVSISKDFIFTKADMSGVNLASYKLVEPDAFVYVPVTSRNGDKITIAHNADEATFIVSGTYEVFRTLRNDLLDSGWLFMYFNRPEFDRYARFHSWGSARETFSWDELCSIEIDLPPIEVQRRYTAIYEGLDSNRRDNLRRLADMKLACDAAIEQLEACYAPIKIGPYIEQSDERNVDGLGEGAVRGLSIEKKFIDTKASLVGVNLSNYKVVRRGDMAYVPVTSRNGGKITVAHNDGSESYIISPINTVFRVKPSRSNELLPEYLMLFFTRGEFDRYARYHSWGSARETFDWDEMCAVRIPIPDIEAQQALVDLYRARSMRVGINQRLVCLLQNICPILIKGSIEEARRED